MKIQRTMVPGQPGTKKLVNQYGADLICVRYRYDIKSKQRLTTVEIVVDRQEWSLNESRVSPQKNVYLKIAYGEKELAQKVKSLGGQWDRGKKAWKLSYKYAQLLRLEDRIIK